MFCIFFLLNNIEFKRQRKEFFFFSTKEKGFIKRTKCCNFEPVEEVARIIPYPKTIGIPRPKSRKTKKKD